MVTIAPGGGLYQPEPGLAGLSCASRLHSSSYSGQHPAPRASARSFGELVCKNEDESFCSGTFGLPSRDPITPR